MKITHYRFEKGHSNVLQSKVHIAVSAFLGLHHGKLITAQELPVLKDHLRKEVEAINAKFPRCKPVKLGFDSWGTKKDIYIQGVVDWNYTLRACHLSHPFSFLNTMK